MREDILNKKKEMMRKGGDIKVEIVGIPESMIEAGKLDQEDQDASPYITNKVIDAHPRG